MKLRALVPWTILTTCVLLLGCKGGSTAPHSTGSKPGTSTAGAVSAEELVKEYKAGDADSKYKGKEITVKGTVVSVRKDSVELKGMPSQNVRCQFSDAGAMKDVKKDDEITVKGTCQGKQGTADSFNVNLQDCKLVK